ncbi:CocE/NonD family hydrolase [Luteimonas sp. SJ-92]|uniref:CocE/NonD family hydrolase n=1 Tax=Luteimonas salinisoli TaxID=2752307 RepID=A0A853JA06_9GAMM|nr:CocE/NonD family hydrolase [Luteimonas salinisoli]NZA25685.1 CocE/NonD family hydrolase [Luteimonas salinisoli]
MRIVAVLVLFLLALPVPHHVAAQDVPYGLAAAEAKSLDRQSLALFARRVLALAPVDRLPPGSHERTSVGIASGAATAAPGQREPHVPSSADPAALRRFFLDLYAEARPGTPEGRRAAVATYRGLLRQRMDALDPVVAERLCAWFETHAANSVEALDRQLSRHAGAATVALDEAIEIAEAYADHLLLETFGSATAETIEALRADRFVVDDAILIRTPEGASLSATLVRPAGENAPLETAMYFTIYSDRARNRRIAAMAAAHGYAGIVVNARGKLDSPDAIRPYETEAADTVAAIEWVARQPWSDGRVGMYGGSYTGFAAWAATKRRPEALKTIVPYVAAIPGQGLPMENGVFLNANYAWAFYVTNNRTLDREVNDDRGRWASLNENWYRSGRAYREIDAIDGTPNPWLQRWLEHPTYDGYWQAMVPYGEEFGQIDIPVLSITGYYDDGQISAVHYLKEHYRHDSDAEHHLVIGPYDHFGAQQEFKPETLRDSPVDPVAQFNTTELTFAWFDHVFRGAPKPAILKDRINYQVMGANRWRHAPSIAAMSAARSRLFLASGTAASGRMRLTADRSEAGGEVVRRVDFSDRQTTDAGYYPFPIVDTAPNFSEGLVFESEPFEQPVEISGGFSGRFRVRSNRRDFDFFAALYELRPDGSSFALSYYVGRASQTRDLARRDLLSPGEVVDLPFDRTRLVSKRFAAGSRLVLVVDILKNGFHQVNYGTGGAVAEETIADAGTPLEVEWLPGSFIEVPLSHVDASAAVDARASGEPPSPDSR